MSSPIPLPGLVFGLVFIFTEPKPGFVPVQQTVHFEYNFSFVHSFFHRVVVMTTFDGFDELIHSVFQNGVQFFCSRHHDISPSPRLVDRPTKLKIVINIDFSLFTTIIYTLKKNKLQKKKKNGKTHSSHSLCNYFISNGVCICELSHDSSFLNPLHTIPNTMVP